VRLTSKCQVTIPKGIRDQVGLMPGDAVAFRVAKGEVRMVKVDGQPSRGARAVEAMRGRATVQMTTDEIMALTRGE
jgi:antitoxin PrlF